MPALGVATCRVATTCGYIVGEEIGQSWGGLVIANSLLIAIAGAFTSLTITSHLRHCRDRFWFIIFTLAAGLGLGVNTVWSMHFVGMQALNLGGGKISGATALLRIEFEVGVTVLSAIAAWLVAAAGIYVMSNRDVRKRTAADREMFCRLGRSTALIAVGVVLVHYAGMLSQTGSFDMEYDPMVILASASIAAVASSAGLVILMVFPDTFVLRFWSSVIISCAVNSMHYTGMLAATYRVSSKTRVTLGSYSRPIDGGRVALGVLVFDIVLYAVCQHYGDQQRRQLEGAAQQNDMRREQQMQRKIAAAVKSMEELGHPMITVPSKVFLEMDGMDMHRMHEGIRPTGQLKYFDTKRDVDVARLAGAFVIFFSYECLSWTQAGPNTDQLSAMKSAVREIATRHEKQLRDVYVWLDCLSIPQRNRAVKAAAINSIYTLAGLPDAMVVVCPDSVHSGTQTKANDETIKKRLWCRMEQVAYCCSKGTRSMYIHCGERLEPLPPDWMESVCCVYEAESTCCRLRHPKAGTCDREVLVLPLLALFHDVVTRTRRKACLVQDVYAFDLVQRNRERMFPKSFEYYTGESLKGENRELFGDMLDLMEGTHAPTRRESCKAMEMCSSVSSYDAKLISDIV